MLELGTVIPGKTIRIPYSSFDSNDPSASVAPTGFVVGDIQVYKDGGTTQRASTAGFTATTSFDTIVGANLIIIDLADNTTAGFYSAGSEYLVAIDTISIDGALVQFFAARFRIGYPGALLDTTIATRASATSFTLTVGSADDDAYNGCTLYTHDVASSIQFAIGFISDYTGSTKTVTLATDPGIFTSAVTDNISILPPTLLPTTLGRTLDVTAGGAAGIDWANVENPTTALDLSGTDIQLVDTATAVTNQVTADVTAVSGDSTAADNLELDYDGTGFDKANSTIGTTTTNTDMRGTEDAAKATTLGTPGDFGSGTLTIAANLEDMADDGTAAFDRSTDSLQAIRDNTPANFSGLGITAGAIDDVTLVATTTTSTDMRGTDGVDTATMRGTDSALLAADINLTAGTVDRVTLVDTTTVNTDMVAEPAAIVKNAAFSDFEFLMVLTSDHVTPATGLTVTGQRSIDGGAFAGVDGTIAEVSNGIYQFDALAADTNGDVITWRFSSATADDTFFTFTTTT